MRRPHLDSAHLFFLIHKPISFKKLNGVGRDGKILKPVPFTFDFCFYFVFLIFLHLLFYFYYIKINIFHKK